MGSESFLRCRSRAFLMSRAFAPACLAGAILLRLAWILALDVRPVDDFSWYWQRAVDLSEGRGFVDGDHATAYWPVGYPLLLAGIFGITGPSLFAAQAANILLYLGAMLLTAAIARRMLGDERAARLAMLLMALHLNHIAYTSLTGTEILFLVLLQLGVLLFLASGGRPVAAVASGAVFGAACLTRPQVALLPAFLLGAQALGRLGAPPARRLTANGLVLYLTLAAVLIPWTVRNYEVFGSFVFVANSGGTNLLIGNNPAATGGYGAPAIEPVAEGEKRRDDLAARMAIRHIVDHPWRTLSLVPWKIWHLYAKDVEGLYWVEVAMGRGEGAPPERPLFVLKLVAQAWYVALLSCFAAWAFFRMRAERASASSRPWDLGLWIVAYHTLVFCVLFGSSRFHFPLVPYLDVYAGSWLGRLRGAPEGVTAVLPTHTASMPAS